MAPRRLPRVLEPDELQALLKQPNALCATGLRNRALLELLSRGAGLRVGEALALRPAHIRWSEGVLEVREGKGAKDRFVYIGGKAHRALARYWNTRDDDLEDDAPAWLDNRGKALQFWGLRQLFYRLEVRSGVHITAHAFRRTFAIEMLRNGCDVYSLQRLMGHADLTVLRRYLDLVEADLEKAHRRASPVDHLL